MIIQGIGKCDLAFLQDNLMVNSTQLSKRTHFESSHPVNLLVMPFQNNEAFVEEVIWTRVFWLIGYALGT